MKMYQQKTVEKYKDFLNQVQKALLEQDGAIRITPYIREHRVSARLFSYALKKNYFATKNGSWSNGYIPVKVTPFTTADVQEILEEMNYETVREKQRAKQALLESLPPKQTPSTEEAEPSVGERFHFTADITSFRTEDLIAELKRRGFTGIIERREEISF